MRRLVSLGLLGAVALGAFLYIDSGTPSWLDRLHYPLRYGNIVRGHARHYNLEPALLAAVIYQESRFRPDVRSSSGAIGLMQLEPATAEGIAVHTGGGNFRVSDLYDPEINIRYGCWYLRHLLVKYGNEQLALAAYNAGQLNVDTWRREGKGIVFSETRDYVEKVEHLKAAYQHGYGADLNS
jgi:soluble lytic murein transglycosylase